MKKVKLTTMAFAISLCTLPAWAMTDSAVGTYTLPVSEELREHATFPIVDLDVQEYGEGKYSLKYSLPLELTGTPQQIFLMGQMNHDDSGTMNGPNADAECRRADNNITCAIKYKGLAIDPDSVLKKLQGMGLAEQVLEKKIQVARQFSSDPIGIIIYQK